MSDPVTEAINEEDELNHLVEILGNEKAQRSVDAHLLPELVVAEQHKAA
jgi:hypothetical protein